MANNNPAETAGSPATAVKPAEPAKPQEHLVVTQHKLQVGKRVLEYTAVCGTLVLLEPEAKDGEHKGDKARATVFFTAYTLKGVKKPEARPVTFSFNGGPGSSSVWLHLGILGPQRVQVDAMGNAPPPPYGLVDNEHTLLTESDLVFIDPVGTGHSRVAEGEKVAEFHEYQRDLDSIGEFIRLYLSRYKRWASPKYLIGESYGTTRGAGLARHLQEKHDIYLNGVMLVSLALDFQTLSFDHGNELPYALYLPTFAATAWYHKALRPALQKMTLSEVVAAAETFANTDYIVALMQGSRLDPKTRQRIAEQLALYSGLSVEFVLRCRLRVDEFRFFKELLRERGQTVGRLDTRFLGMDKDDAGERPEEDASMNNLVGAYANGINRLLVEKLGYHIDAPYMVHAPLWKTWSWKGFENQYVAAGDSLRRAMHANPAMRVYVASGYYDLATPHCAGDYTLSHMGLRDQLAANVQISYFEAGHMMYIHAPSLKKMASELREFVGKL